MRLRLILKSSFQTNVVWVFGIALIKLRRYLFQSSSPPSHFVLFKSVILLVLPHFIVCLSFVVFVVLFNSGRITLGHQEHHAISRHYAQLIYLFAFLLGSSGINLFLPRSGAANMSNTTHGPSTYLPTRLPNQSLIVCFLLLTIFCIFCMSKGFIVHPFILSDNRHFVFYIYRRFLSRVSVRLILLPLCVSLGLSIALQNVTNLCVPQMLDFLIYLFCCVLTLVPTPLIEPRYFHIPTVLYILHLPLTRLGMSHNRVSEVPSAPLNPTSDRIAENGNNEGRIMNEGQMKDEDVQRSPSDDIPMRIEERDRSMIKKRSRNNEKHRSQSQKKQNHHPSIKERRMDNEDYMRAKYGLFDKNETTELFGILINLVIDVLVFYLFLFKPFPSFSHETGEKELGRFMY